MGEDKILYYALDDEMEEVVKSSYDTVISLFKKRSILNARSMDRLSDCRQNSKIT